MFGCGQRYNSNGHLARRRDRGVQAERGFAGNRLHGADALLAAEEEGGRKALEVR